MADKMRNTPSSAVTSGGGKGILDTKKMDREYKYFKFAEGQNRIAVLPYKLSSKTHPLVHSGRLEKGDQFYNLDIYVHKMVGASKADYVCPRRNYGMACPICEAAEEFQKKEGRDSVSAKALWPKRRLYFNIVDLNNMEEGVQILDTNNMDFFEPLENAQKIADTDPDVQEVSPDAYFPLLDNGLTIKVSGIMKKWSIGGKEGESVRASGVTLAPRRKSEDVAGYSDDVVLFDKCIDVLSYEDLDAAFHGAGDSFEDDEDEVVPKFEREEPKAEKRMNPAKKEVKEETECPAGYPFGDAVVDHKECDTCPDALYTKCARAGKKRATDDIPF